MSADPGSVPAPGQKRRQRIVQALLDLTGRGSYLEIGVHRGDTFLAIQAERKVAVDPMFLFDADRAAAEDRRTTFHSVESDVYFGKVVGPAETFDVIFLDGLHTFDQTLRDFCNAIEHVAPGGAIVIDDINPSDYQAALRTQDLARTVRRLRDPEDRNRDWMGDVYRLLFFIDSYFQQWTFAAVAPDRNQLVVWHAPRRRTRRRRIETIARFPYEKTILARAAYNESSLEGIVEAVRRAREESGLLTPPGA